MRSSTGTAEHRNPYREKQERRRFELLRAIQELAGTDCSERISGLMAGAHVGMSREETFRHVQYLAQKGYLAYMGAGPTVCITDTGIQYLVRGARRRRSVR